MLAVNNMSVVASAGLLVLCMEVGTEQPNVYLAGLCLAILFGSLSKCASAGEEMSFTKDWVVVMAQREGYDTLSSEPIPMQALLSRPERCDDNHRAHDSRRNSPTVLAVGGLLWLH